ncbi:MAG: tRNA lysidine(34) synthetase TilS [Zymomonas mobilis]|uniref:tRNA(Ile)-lysidine synthase n=1 Tax=Zymomonas mobilis TaxID=542 RepID=A0A542W307_ZYMMB|nr:tRNA lysidine(34) synthetase TilS [Zymomonas mobilis]TQL17961.1 tRNA(Ile)-lysidine synthase [Zymomonas mobilis]
MKGELRSLLQSELHIFHEAVNRALSSPLSGKLGIAVSGGSDSLALLLLGAASDFLVEAVTVDHGMRPEAAEEARFVADICQQIGVSHQILTTTIQANGEGMQAAARIRRYALMAKWAKEKQVGALMTAHHEDDQAETFLMRAARGSGLNGLSAIRPDVVISAEDQSLRLLRPLLGFSRSDLAAIVQKAGFTFVSDPSNDNPHYDRTHFRRLLKASPWINRQHIAETARYCQQSEEAIEWMTDKEAAARIRQKGSVLYLDPTDLPIEILRRLVLRCMDKTTGKTALRGAALSRFIAALQQGKKAMLADVIGQSGDYWHFSPAPPRKKAAL